MSRKKKYPYTDPKTGFVHVTPWVTLDFYWDKIVAGVRTESWEPDPDNEDMEVRSVYLGSILSISPSGKIYMPFACGNLHLCPCCNGSGKVKPRYSRRVVRRAKNRNNRQRRLWVKRYGYGWQQNWPAHIIAKSDTLNRYMARFSTTCPRCAGQCSHEAQDDQDFFEALEEKLGEYGLAVMHIDDGVYAAEYRSVDDPEETAVP